jgi:hypothetical protein
MLVPTRGLCREQTKERTVVAMLPATARGAALCDERKTAAGLESHDEKFQTR